MKLKIGWITYTLKEVKNPKCNKIEVWGYVDHDSQKIKIEKSLSPPDKERTIIHELLHAISDNYLCELSEDYVDKLSVGIMTFIIDNPEFVIEHINKIIMQDY